MTNLQGKLSISRIQSNQPDEQDTIRIRLEDETSGIEFVEIRLTPEALALALTGLSSQDCSFELHGLQNVGKRRETKEEIIPRPFGFFNMTPEQKREYLSRYEVDGWKVRIDSDFGNNHRRVNDSYRVTFTRFVEAEEVSNV